MRRLQFGLLAGVAVAALAVALPSRAEAGYPYPMGYGFGCGASWGFYTQDYIPYFARHPPVYYSFPVRRTYGYSPWAYPPGVLTPEYRLRPETTSNPYVPRQVTPSSAPAAESRTARVEPLRIRNPYVEAVDEAEVAETPTARQTEPQTIYPVAAFDATP